MASPNLTYLYFDVRGYNGLSILSAYSVPITPLTFVPDFTTSTLLSGDAIISNKKLVWNFGDGTYSQDLTAIHQFKWPGKYKVKLTVFDNSGNAFDSNFQPEIQIYDFINDQIQFKDFKRFIYDVPASKIIDPLRILTQNSWQSFRAISADGGYTVNLYASGSSGDYIDINSYNNDKWSHLRSLSRFYQIQDVGDQEEYVIVDKVKTQNKEIYAKVNNNNIVLCNKEDLGSCFVGTTGYADFYYVDDRVKNFTSRENPIILFCTLDNKKIQDYFTTSRNLFDYIEYPPAGFQNLEPATLPIIKVRNNSADRLTITTTGIDGEGYLSATNFNIPSISWQNTKIPFVVKMKDDKNFTTKTYPPLYSSQIENILPLTSFDLKIGLLEYDNILSCYKEVTGVTFYSDFSPDIPRNIGAFYKGYFTCDRPTYNCKLTATIVVNDPKSFPKDSVVGWIAEPQYQYVKRFLKTSLYDFCKGYVSLTLSAVRNDFRTPGCFESYAIAVAPSGASFREDYRTWIGDGSSDSIFKIDVFGNILSAFPLSAMLVKNLTGFEIQNLLSPVLSSAAPNSIALNSYNDAWISLFDTASVIKVNNITGHVTDFVHPHYQNLVYFLSSDYNLPQLSGFAGENSLIPASIDTDYDDNLWVAYTHPASNFLAKYDTYGTMLTAIPMPWMHSPVELLVDRDSKIWLTAYNLSVDGTTLSGRSDFLYRFDSTGTVLPGYPLSGFKFIGNISVDSQQNAYVVEDKETIVKIDNLNRTMTYYTGGSGNNKTNYIQSIGGIACDTSDFLWVLNNWDNKMYYLDTYLTSITSVSGVDQVDLFYPLSADYYYPVSSFTDQRFQAYGDWLGSRWINKYMAPKAVVRTLSGSSDIFSVYPTQGKFNITKINENFDANSFYNDLRYQESLLDKSVFFDDFLGTIVGKTSAQPYELGKTVYEKIANFVYNNADIDRCNLEKLLSFCSELGIQFEEYNYPFPPQLRRLIDTLTIKHKLLYGNKNTFNYDFNKQNTNNPNIGRNLGKELDVRTAVISSGKPIVAYEIFSDLYDLVNRNTIPNTPYNTLIPLSSFNYNWGWGLVAPISISGVEIKNYYKFFEYIDKQEGSYYNNLINWNDPLTLLTFDLSSYKDWSKTDGIMQNMISYELTKGLKLFLSGSNIVYNN